MKNNKSPYYLVVVASKWTGNFERELIAYSMGVLDEIQMEIKYAEQELADFYREVFNKETPEWIEFDNELFEKFLNLTYQVVDDWEQDTFYNVGVAPKMLNEEFTNADSIIYIQLKKPLDEYWENIIIPRMIKYFADHEKICGELVALRTFKSKPRSYELVKDHLSGDVTPIKDNVLEFETEKEKIFFEAIKKVINAADNKEELKKVLIQLNTLSTDELKNLFE